MGAVGISNQITSSDRRYPTVESQWKINPLQQRLRHHSSCLEYCWTYSPSPLKWIKRKYVPISSSLSGCCFVRSVDSFQERRVYNLRARPSTVGSHTGTAEEEEVVFTGGVAAPAGAPDPPWVRIVSCICNIHTHTHLIAVHTCC